MPNPTAPARRSAWLAALGAGTVTSLYCLGVLSTTPSDSYWINDCGNKALVAQRLWTSGYRSLAFERPAAEVDPSALAFPIAPPFAVARDGEFISVYPPAYAALSAPFFGWFGPVGLRIPALLGAAASAALLAFWLAGSVGFGWAFAAGTSLGLATPLAFYGVTVWEHSLTVALTLAAWVLASRAEPARLVAAGALIGCACWFREELAGMGVALALGSFAVSRRSAPTLWLLAGASVPAALLLWVNAQLYGAPLGLHFAASAGAGADASGLPADSTLGTGRILAGVLAGHVERDAEAALLAAFALGAPLLGWIAARRSASGAAAGVACGVVGLVAWALAAGRIVGAASPLAALVRHNGLLLQLPLFALAGIGAARVFGRVEYAPLRVGAAAGALFGVFAVTAGVLDATGYGVQSGFGVHWGPRALLPAFPAFVLFAVAAVRDGIEQPGVWRSRISAAVAALLLVAGLLSTALATALLAAQKTEASAFQVKLLAQPARYVVTTHPLLAQHLASLWYRKPMLLARNPRELKRVVAGLRSGGAREFLLIAPAGGPLLGGFEGLACHMAARHRGAWLHYFDHDIQTCGFQMGRVQ